VDEHASILLRGAITFILGLLLLYSTSLSASEFSEGKNDPPDYNVPYLPFPFVTNYTTWLKANDAASITTSTNGSPVTVWGDVALTGTARDFNTALGTAPIYSDNNSGIGIPNINFNPTIDFNAFNLSQLNLPNNNEYNLTPTAAGDPYFTRKAIFLTFRTDTDITTRQVIYEQGGNVRGINLYLVNGTLYASTYNRAETAPLGDWNSAAGSVNTVSIGIDPNTAYIATLELRGDVAGTGNFEFFLNGTSLGTINNVGVLYEHPSDVNIGFTDQTLFEDLSSAAGFHYEGQIAELIYRNEPTLAELAERNIVESYLAIKYGLTLDQTIAQDYVNSGGTTIWDASVNGTYDFDIAGIGRDDDAQLDQLRSKSENPNSIVTMEKTTSFGTDQSFLIWGNDGNANNETTTDLPSPSTITRRIRKEWRVDEDVDVGTVDISFDLSELTISGTTTDPTQFNLLVAASGSGGNFGSATIIGSPTISGTTLTFSNVDLADGEYFTLGTSTQNINPGGVVGADIWFRADDGAVNTGDGTDVTSWEDRSTTGYDLSDGGTNPYLFRSNGLNFNPTIDNPGGTNRRLINATTIDLQTVYLVTIPDNPGNNDNPFSERNTNSNKISVNNAAQWNINGGANDFATIGGGGSFWFNGLSVVANPSHGNAPNMLVVQASGSNTLTNGLELGDTQGNRYWHGDIAEVIAYDAVQIATDRNKIESYLAIKYGITLDQTVVTNYVDSNDNIFWDGTTNAAYNQSIAGIGRDDESGLEQKQSRSVDTDAILTIGNVTVAATNATNPNTFSGDLEWLAWGHDGASALQVDAIISTDVEPINNPDDTPLTVDERMLRKWRVQKTGNVDEVTVSFDLNGLGYSTSQTDFTLLISNANDFDNATIIANGSIVGTEIQFSNVNFNDGDYFTLGTSRTLAFGPGGLSNLSGPDDPLTTWLRADIASRVTSSTDGATVTLWEDVLNGVYDFSTGIAAPRYNDNAVANVNFNQNIEFIRTNTAGLTTGNNNDYNLVSGTPFVRKGIQIAFSTSSDITNRQVIYEQGGQGRGVNIYIRNGSLHISAWNRAETAPLGDWNNTGNVTSASEPINANETYVLSFELEGDDSGVTANGTLNLYLNGRLVDSFGGIGVLYNHGGLIGMGYAQNDTFFDNGGFAGDGEHFNGKIAEFIYSNEPASFTALQRNQTESYLAIKYGVTLDQTSAQNYTNSSGAIVWDAAANGIYNNDIAGIARDDISILSQLRSKSENADAIVTMASPSSLPLDDSWLIWANDNVALEGTEADGNTDFNRAEGIFSRLFREWRVQETNTIGTVEVTFDVSAIDNILGVGTNDLTALRLMVDADGTFASGATYYSPVSVNSFLGTATFEVDFTSGEYFTLGSIDIYALPVELTDFDARLNERSQVNLAWVTASESNNDFFSVEHSTDGQHFERIGLVAGVGNSAVQSSYAFTHTRPNNGFNYYRLKQNDFNGDFEYSWIESVYVESAKAIEAKLFPNPVKQGDAVILDLNEFTNYALKIMVYNTKGRVVKSMNLSELESDRTLKLNTAGFSKGLNLIRILTNTGESQVLKLLVN